MNRKLMVTAIVSAATLLGGCAASGSATITSEVAQANPWVDYDTLAEAQEEVGFEINVPDMSEYGSDEIYRVCAALTELEIEYGDDTYIRKADDDGDISGDYNEYEYETDGDAASTLKGDSADKIYLAIWQDGDYAYCIHIGSGVSEDVMNSLIAQVE